MQPSRASAVRFWESARIMENACELGDVEQGPSAYTMSIGSDGDQGSIQSDV